MTSLVIAEHDNATIKPSTLNTVTAAAQCGGDVHVLVAGHNAGEAAKAASQIAGVTKVIHAEGEHLAHGLAENMAAQVLGIAGNYSHILFPATASGVMISLNFSADPRARPPDTTTLAAVSSGRSFLASSLPRKLDFPLAGAAAACSIAAEPPVAAAASNPVVRTVITLTASRLCTTAMALPA